MNKIKIHTENAISWQQHLSKAITSIPELLDYVGLPRSLTIASEAATNPFKLLAPYPYLDRIEKGNASDPLLLQILPVLSEMKQVEGYYQDPLDEANHTPQKALVHKYKRRLLVITTGACAINCRYCFRRHFPYGDNQLAQDEWLSVLDYIKQHPDINEIIFSGGDPLIMKDQQLAKRIESLDALPQLKRLRIHSRLPVVIPQRVTEDMLQWIRQTRLDVIMVLHINHANEVDKAVSLAVQKLKRLGVTLFNQGVILNKVNDTVADQVNLSETLFKHGILPYYMFLFDPVAGAAHFDVPLDQAQKLMGEVAAELPGYLVPRLAKEIPGKTAKTLFAPTL
ncbi:EF-P beta-lysylation protein EpmB [Marinomonas sp. 15G1-11]|uniref:L-lysine 2,3-aminomutase n=1 Tax=Marinomonas phaeophyticola TaxID=3004091 RepID=A0ABT4JR44_9GAMM|nr:EF-P beta-lysylation protein EpmB [Marinomonas sp. 15G1-11]MCZ2720845.1 EF-P beta-lysylation protein EpmB [Marinomonas sp. 15G1-11]